MSRKPKSDAYKKLSRHLSKQISKANKRYDRMKKAGWNSPAMQAVKATGGRFKNGRNMTYREMQKEQRRVENFLKMKTSSKTGTRKAVKNMLKSTGMDKYVKSGDVMSNKSTMNKYFKVYKKLREYEQTKGVGRSYQATFDKVTGYFASDYTDNNASVDDILDNIVSDLSEGEYVKDIDDDYFML